MINPDHELSSVSPQSQDEKPKRVRTRNSTLFNISTFLVKIYEILSKAEMEDIIKWTEDGLAFMIIDQTKFSNEVLPIYFKHSNFSSFIR